MITNLALDGFKNFKHASLKMGGLTLLVGTNASGKSNLRDAFRFLHGVSRGYSVAEIIGEKYIEGGALQWRGIRGGTREVAYRGTDQFSLTVDLDENLIYKITVEVTADLAPCVLWESLRERGGAVYHSHGVDNPAGKGLRYVSLRPVLAQIAANDKAEASVKDAAKRAIDILGSMRFLDLSPDAMRLPSIPGQTILGDRGENLSSVLQAIVSNPKSKIALLEWLKELTPLDVTDLEFVADQTGKILLSLVEAIGQKTSAYSASDGTLRFLAMIAAVLGPEPAKLYFFEEFDNGIHPTRLHLLLRLMEKDAAAKTIQVIASTHSPQLLGFLSKESRENAVLVYRLPHEDAAQITRIMNIPQAAAVLAKQDLARLHASGWLEDAVAFNATAAEPSLEGAKP